MIAIYRTFLESEKKNIEPILCGNCTVNNKDHLAAYVNVIQCDKILALKVTQFFYLKMLFSTWPKRRTLELLLQKNLSPKSHKFCKIPFNVFNCEKHLINNKKQKCT